MTALFPWFVFLHIVGLVVFVACHGVSMFAAFRMRARPDRAQVTMLLELSNTSTRLMYLGLLFLAIGGLGAGAVQGLLTAGWVVWTTLILVLVIVAMYAVGARFYYGLRDRLGATADAPTFLSDDELTSTLRNRIPDVLAAIGIGGLVVMIWLMVVKPI